MKLEERVLSRISATVIINALVVIMTSLYYRNADLTYCGLSHTRESDESLRQINLIGVQTTVAVQLPRVLVLRWLESGIHVMFARM
jgi:hypothetical protein